MKEIVCIANLVQIGLEQEDGTNFKSTNESVQTVNLYHKHIKGSRCTKLPPIRVLGKDLLYAVCFVRDLFPRLESVTFRSHVSNFTIESGSPSRDICIKSIYL